MKALVYPTLEERQEAVVVLAGQIARRLGGVASQSCTEAGCRAGINVMCKRPSGHAASDYHKSRKLAFDLAAWKTFSGEYAGLMEGWKRAGWHPESAAEVICPGCFAPPTVGCLDVAGEAYETRMRGFGWIHKTRARAWEAYHDEKNRAFIAEEEAEAARAGKTLFRARCECGYQSMAAPSSRGPALNAMRHKCWQTCRLEEYDPATQEVISSQVIPTGTPGAKEPAPAPSLRKLEAPKPEPQRTLDAWGVLG